MKHIKLFEQFSEEEYDRILDIYNKFGEELMTPEEIKYLKSGGTSEIPKNKMSDSDRKILSDLTNMKKETIKDKLLQLPYNLFFDALKNTFLTKDVQLVKDYVRAYIEKYPDAYRDFNFIDYLIELGEYYGIEKGYRW